MKFIDLFSGLGGFHVALNRLGHECVFASEIDETLRSLYDLNFGIRPRGDIREIRPLDVPRHDILCAGFPCQPFSKAGEQLGRDCPRWGDLFDHVMKIIRARRPKYLLLENVPNLSRHAGGSTWQAMRNDLKSAGYHVSEKRLSPHQFGIPQIRERIYIVGSISGSEDFEWPEPGDVAPHDIRHALENNPSDAGKLSDQVIRCLDVWQHFIMRYPDDQFLPTYPIWSMEFGATYPYEKETPHSLGLRRLSHYRGAHGCELRSLPQAERLQGIPSYARVEEERFPDWKVNFIRKNRDLYDRHASWINKWLPELAPFPACLQKLEWNCKGGERNIWNYVIQFRASGVRVKRPTSSPSLVAMTTTQVPIIGWERRYMTPRECARLQGLSSLVHLPAIKARAFKSLGNAVNADIVELIARAMLAVKSGRMEGR